MSKYAIYRHYPTRTWQLSTQAVKRNGEIVTFKNKPTAEQWIKDELLAGRKPSTTDDTCEWVVRKYIKNNLSVAQPG